MSNGAALPLHQQATAGSQPTRSAHASVCAALRAEASGRDLGPKKATGDERARCLDRERARDELDFALSTQTVHTGTVTFKVTNNGGIPHNLRINGKQTFGSEVEASDKQQLRRVELAGLEPATSWVRYRRGGATWRRFGLLERPRLLLSQLRFGQFGSTVGRSGCPNLVEVF
jgi:hypothetical protein